MSQYLGTVQVGNNPKPTVEIYLDSYRREVREFLPILAISYWH